MSTVSASPTASEFIYGPTVPIESSDFMDDTFDPEYIEAMVRDTAPETGRETYDETGSEAIGAAIDQIEAYANDPANNAQALRDSRGAIETLTTGQERQRLAERAARIAYIATAGRNTITVRGLTREGK